MGSEEEEEEEGGRGVCDSGSAMTCTSEEHNSSRSCCRESGDLSVVSSVVDGEKKEDGNGGIEQKKKADVSELEMLKERLAKLLLGEDMSGCGKGSSTALSISNAITNLCATFFGQILRLEPLPPEKKAMWRREIEWLLCVSDHIVEFVPSSQTFPDGSKLEVMTCKPRSDLFINLPALRKLDNMLIEILDSFVDAEFWYVDQGILPPDSDGLNTQPQSLQRQKEKWWLPVPRIPSAGLHEKSRKELEDRRECTNQILKAVMSINDNVLAEMDVPDPYMESLPKNGKTSLGDVIHRYITSDQFYPECLLDCLDLSSEHQALELANRIEAVIFIWRRRANTKPSNIPNRGRGKTSWVMVKELLVDVDRRELFADRAESLLICLKQRFPGLMQTTLDMSKIQYNKDVGKSILEAYSRVLESLAFNIIARIDDLLYVDDIAKHSNKFSSTPIVSSTGYKRVMIPYVVPISSTPYGTAYTTPCTSPAPLISSARNDRMPPNGRGFDVKKVLTDYLGVEVKVKNFSNLIDRGN